MKPIAVLCLLLLALDSPKVHAQAEAQSSGEVMEFQNLKVPRSTFDVKAGDYVSTPPKGDQGSLEMRGTVTALTDSSLVIAAKKDGRERVIHLGRVKEFTRVNRVLNALGWVALGLGFLAGIPFVLATAEAFGITGFYGYLIVGFQFIFINIGLLAGLLVAALFWAVGRQKVWLHKWSWKRKRKIYIKKSTDTFSPSKQFSNDRP